MQFSGAAIFPQRLKESTFIEIFSNGAAAKKPEEQRKKISKNFDFSVWSNHATTLTV